MKSFKIKVCGITRETDAELAIRLGVDFIGMIFSRKSPRFIALKSAEKIVRLIPATVSKVGVFVDQDPVKIKRVAAKLRLDFIQLHGSESEAEIKFFQKAGLKVIKAFHLTQKSDLCKISKCRADLILLDNAKKNQAGGTGLMFDWSFAKQTRLPNLVLAGGISAENLTEGIKRFKPLLVDLNSMVESSPGIKSERKLRQFFKVADKLRYGQ